MATVMDMLRQLSARLSRLERAKRVEEVAPDCHTLGVSIGGAAHGAPIHDEQTRYRHDFVPNG